MKGRMLIAVVTLGALVSGCATISESTCRTSDWQNLGYRDALKGLESRAKDLQEACPAFRATDYANGREEGLDEFCTSEQGYEFGARGGNYRGTCSGALGVIFERAYVNGRVVAELEQQLEAIEREMQDIEYKLDNPSLTRDQYYYLRSRLNELEQQRRGYEQQLARVRR